MQTILTENLAPKSIESSFPPFGCFHSISNALKWYLHWQLISFWTVIYSLLYMQGIGSHKRQNGLIKKLNKSFEHTLVVSIKTRTLQRHKLKAAWIACKYRNTKSSSFSNNQDSNTHRNMWFSVFIHLSLHYKNVVITGVSLLSKPLYILYKKSLTSSINASPV